MCFVAAVAARPRVPVPLDLHGLSEEQSEVVKTVMAGKNVFITGAVQM